MERNLGLATLIGAALLLGGCQTASEREAERRRVERDKGSPAYKAGQVAHTMAKEAGKAAEVAGRKIAEEARKAREGWKEQERKDRDRDR